MSKKKLSELEIAKIRQLLRNNPDLTKKSVAQRFGLTCAGLRGILKRASSR
jgi:hypothetical protein